MPVACLRIAHFLISSQLCAQIQRVVIVSIGNVKYNDEK